CWRRRPADGAGLRRPTGSCWGCFCGARGSTASASGSCGSGTPAASRSCSARGRRKAAIPTRRGKWRSGGGGTPALGKLGKVWQNPVLWREIRTLAYGRRPLLVKLAFGIVLALILYFAVTELNRPGGRPTFAAAYGLVPIAVLSLLLVAAQAATSVTSERDGGALDVLLVTDVSPYEFVFG